VNDEERRSTGPEVDCKMKEDNINGCSLEVHNMHAVCSTRCRRKHYCDICYAEFVLDF
jgi:hypothetical protein